MSETMECRPSERELALSAHRRSRAFRIEIETKAASLRAPKALPPEAMPAETDPPGLLFGLPSWYLMPLKSATLGRVSMRQIQKAVCDYFNISLIDITSARRTRDMVRPRQIACYLCKELTPFSLPAIGRFFGGRDHTTVLHAVRKIMQLMHEDQRMALDVVALIEIITGEPL